MSFLGQSVNPIALDPLNASIGSKFDKTGPNFLGSYRNKIVNGNFQHWQRGTSSSAVGYATADRWRCNNVGTTRTASQQTFAPGQTVVPGNPGNFFRHVVSSVAGSGNYCLVEQVIESVFNLQGGLATYTFWAKADAARNIAVEVTQYFGTGGSPSATVTSIGVTTCALTTSWQKFSIVVTIPSITGKTVGTNGDSGIVLTFWMDAGSTYNSRTNSLGQQSGTFDFAHVSMVEGDATAERDPFENRSHSQEEALCKRYFQIVMVGWRSYATQAANWGYNVTFPYSMRTAPTITLSGTIATSNATGENLAAASPYSVRWNLQSVAAGDCYLLERQLWCDAEL